MKLLHALPPQTGLQGLCIRRTLALRTAMVGKEAENLAYGLISRLHILATWHRTLVSDHTPHVCNSSVTILLECYRQMLTFSSTNASSCYANLS